MMSTNSPDVFEEQPRQEFVKCIVIGDTGVGKTRLICSYLFDQDGLTLRSLYQKPHTPTIFAIDQYIVNPVVRRKTHLFVDGAPVHLQVWDTFGDHEKDRRYSFQTAHVVVLCFSIGSLSSLRHVHSKWNSEIKKYCPRAPIILVGTQLDRRHSDPSLFNQTFHQVTTLSDFLNNSIKGILCKSNKTSFVKSIAPEVGRNASREINASAYLETSVVTKYGVNEVFESAIRAALISRRQGRPHIFSSSLKNIEKPGLQKPYLPEKSLAPEIEQSKAIKEFDFKVLLGDSNFSDVTFILGSQIVSAHSVPLIISSSIFRSLFSCCHVSTFASNSIPKFSVLDLENKIITEKGYVNILKCCQLPRGYNAVEVSNSFGVCAFCMTIINVDALSFNLVLEFLYTGNIRKPIPDIMQLFDVADYLQENSLVTFLSNLINEEDYLNSQVTNFFVQNQRNAACILMMNSPFLADVAFSVEGVAVPAHKQILVSQCTVMDAMFKEGGFKESMLQQVRTFLFVFEYTESGSKQKAQ